MKRKATLCFASCIVGYCRSLNSGLNATFSQAGESATLTVFAASSLNVTFPLIQAQFEKKHPGVKVQFSFLSSSVLANQIVAGAPADVFASASEKDMATAKVRVPVSSLFAANRIVVAFPKTGKFEINKLVDLNKPGLKWIQCTHTAPCGAVADASLASFRKVTSKPVSY
ncbi:MAG: extracellular solute-binding protein [Actinomycetota bacterium]